jgi:hypothetical protein
MSQASPLPDQRMGSLSKFQARVTIGDFSCPDGAIVYDEDVENAVKASQAGVDSKIGGYPVYLGTNIGVPNTNLTKGSGLKQFPIQVGGVYLGGKIKEHSLLRRFNIAHVVNQESPEIIVSSPMMITNS